MEKNLIHVYESIYRPIILFFVVIFNFDSSTKIYKLLNGLI